MGATSHHLKYMTNCYKNIFVLICCNGNQQEMAQRELHIKFFGEKCPGSMRVQMYI